METFEFGIQPSNSNFSLGVYNSESMQFYNNMRFTNPRISYLISDCTLQKEADMRGAFEFISNLTVLDFYSVSGNEDISVTCDSHAKIEGGMFIAGEGGPTNVSVGKLFNVITHGKILLLRDSNCEKPNVAIHELLHVLGFEHSLNENNLMYNISRCKQTIGEDIPALIDELYSIPSYPELEFENVSALMNGRYLDLNFTVRNNGLADSNKIKINLYADEKLVKEFDLESVAIGYGRIISVSNLLINKINVNELKMVIDYRYAELDKNNNEVVLNIKK